MHLNNLISELLFFEHEIRHYIKITTKPVVEISVGCWRKPTGFHKKADRPIVKNGKKAYRLLHKVVKYLLVNNTVPEFAIV